MGSERKDGAGKSLDALVCAFRESPFAVFDPEKSSVGIFEERHIESAEILLTTLPYCPNAVRDFFSYVNRQLILCEYSDKDFQTIPLSRLQFAFAFSMELQEGTEYKYRLERDRDYLAYYDYGAMTDRVFQMMPRMIRDFYMKLKSASFTPAVVVQTHRMPRNPPYSKAGSSMVA